MTTTRSRSVASVAVAIAMSFLLVVPSVSSGGDREAEFAGSWSGAISESKFDFSLWEKHGEWNATIAFNGGEKENLNVLGYKKEPGIFYFFRPGDKACLAVFRDRGATTLAYFEKDTVRKSELKRR